MSGKNSSSPLQQIIPRFSPQIPLPLSSSHQRSRSSELEKDEELGQSLAENRLENGQSRRTTVATTTAITPKTRERGDSVPLLRPADDKATELGQRRQSSVYGTLSRAAQFGLPVNQHHHQSSTSSSLDGCSSPNHPLSSQQRPSAFFPTPCFDYRRPSLPNSVLAREMVRSMESESPSQIGSCTSLLKTLREEGGSGGGQFIDSDPEIELAKIMDAPKVAEEKEDANRLGILSPQLLSPFRSPSPREAKFIRRRQQQQNDPRRRGSAQQKQSQEGQPQQFRKPSCWTSQTDLRTLEQQQQLRSRVETKNTFLTGNASYPSTSKSPSKKRRKSTIPQLETMRQLVRLLKKKGGEQPQRPSTDDHQQQELKVTTPRDLRRFSMIQIMDEWKLYNEEDFPDVAAVADHLPTSPAFSSTDATSDLGSPGSPMVFARPQLIHPRWSDLALWIEEDQSWTSKFPAESKELENIEKKRQNIIYELMMTEKNHCQVIVLLRQVYLEGLIQIGILDKETLKKLIPDVLDVLLDFHLNLLRRLRSRCAEASAVQDISDIFFEEFGESQFRAATIRAYTTFCLSRENCCRMHTSLMAQKTIIRKFFQSHEGNFKDRSFKACLLMIAQRLTKYPILIEQILKYESSPSQRQNMQKAHSSVKAFTLEINNELLRYERKAQWETLKKALDKGSSGKLIDPKAKQDFTYADLVEPVEKNEPTSEGEWGRKVHLIQRVFWRETMTSPDVELRLVLCDDIIAFLRPKSNSNNGTVNGATTAERKELPFHFFRHSSHSGIIPLYNTLVKGENLRRKTLLLIVTTERPDLIQLAFPTSPELEQCVHAIKQAKANAPKFVRLSKGRIIELAQRSIGERASREEKEYQLKMDNWQSDLEGIFTGYNEDSLLVSYFEYRMAFFDTVRSHLHKCPLRHFNSGEEQQKRMAERERERLSLLLKAKFKELGEKRNGALAKLVERAQRARDADLPSFFDDLYDLGAAESETPSQGVSSDEPAQMSGSSDNSEAPKAIGSEKKKPRRVRTYHGQHGTAGLQKNLSGSSSGSNGGHPIRRHTTVPAGGHAESSDEEEEEADAETRKLPLKMNPISRKAATEIIRDNIRLRTQNDRFKKDSALKDLQLASLRSRKGPCGETPERLESLRQKQEELQAQKREFRTECERKEEEFRERSEQMEREMQRKEEEMAKQTDELERMKAEMDKMRKESSTEQTPNNVLPQTPTKTPSNSAIRINTYCGAGPVPRSSIDHQPPTISQLSQNAQISADRRSVSQMELPRHLAVKTETKQADKLRKSKK